MDDKPSEEQKSLLIKENGAIRKCCAGASLVMTHKVHMF